jgi:MATE family multidrug resistance protein
MNPRAGAILRKVAGQLRPGSSQTTIRRDVLRLALPAMGEQMLAMMVGIVDTFLVGHLGAASLAAVGLAAQWVLLANTLLSAVATGSTALIARFVGAREPLQANHVLRQSMLMGVFVGLGCTVLGVSLARPAVLLIGAQADVVDLSSLYLGVVSHVLFLSTLMFVGNASLRGAGDTRTPLYVMVLVNILNVSVAWITINGMFGLPKLGVLGSALGAATGQGAGGLLVIAILLRGRSNIRLRLANLRPDWDMIRRILRVGLPTGMEQLLLRTGQMFFASILATLGTIAYAANQVAINSWSLSFMPGFGFALAATTLVGQSLGAKDPEGAQQRGYLAYQMGAILMAVIGLGFVLFPASIVGFFTNDPQVIAVGILPLRAVGLVQPLLAASMIFSGALRGAGDTRYPMVVTGLTIWLIRLPFAYLFALVFGWGLAGAWSAMACDMSVRGLLNFLRYRAGRWKTLRV